MKRGEPTFDAEEVGADVSFIDVFNTDPDTIPTLIQAGLIDSRPNTPIDDIIGDGYNVFISDTFVLEANIYVFDAAFAQMYEDELAEYLDPCDSAEDGVDEMVEMSSDLDESRARKALLMVSEEESVAEALDEIGPIVDYIDDVIQSPSTKQNSNIVSIHLIVSGSTKSNLLAGKRSSDVNKSVSNVERK